MTVPDRAVLFRILSKLRRRARGAEVEATLAPTAVPRLGYVVHGAAGLHPGSAHIRVVRRVNREVVAGRIEARQIRPEDVVTGVDPLDVDVVLVQRDAVPASLVDGFVRAVRSAGIRLAAEVDDDFFTAAARERLARAEYDEGRLASVEVVVREADVVIVSTEALAEVVRPLAREVVVALNELDAEFWVDPRPMEGGVRSHGGHAAVGDGRIHALYMGSATHHDDLASLETVFDGLETADGTAVVLDVVGVTDDPSDAWFERVEIPEPHHPEFVGWLRRQAPRWSVGVAPLTDAPFNRSKSDLKFLEYTLLGLPTVASASVAYQGVQAHGGALARDEGEWRRAVLDAVDHGLPAEAVSYVTRERLLGSSTQWASALGFR